MTGDEAAALPLGAAQPVQDGIHRGHTPPERPARREVSHELHLLPQVREAVLPDAAAQGENDNLTTGGGRAVRAARPCRLKRDLFPAVPERIFVAAEGPQWAGIPAVS